MDEITVNNLKKHGFVFVSELGSGGFGTVVKVKHKISNQYFAVKKLKSSRKENPENILREIQAIASLNDPNVISYNHSFIEDNELYLVMEYCSRGSLRDWLSKTGKLEIDYTVNIFLRLTHTFGFLHKKGYIHHDIKPDNILFTEDKVKISDFGTVNTSIGTIVYSAPEMLIPGAPSDDPRVDVFSLGITFLECITGGNPLRIRKSIDEQNLIVKKADYKISHLPYWLQQLLLKACHYDPAARFQSMMKFHEAIKKRHIPQIINQVVIDSNNLAEKLKMRIVGRKWDKAKKFIEANDNESIAFLIQKGKYYLGTHKLSKARETFEIVLNKDRSAQIEKNIAEIYLQFNEPSKAATILHGYINKHFNNIEAHNQLLHSYFLSGQWELGLEQAKFLRVLFPKEEIFVNNLNLFELLLDEYPSEIELLHSRNPFGHYNYFEVVADNYPEAYDATNKTNSSLKLKILFHEYKFRNIHKSKNTVAVEIDGEIQQCDERIISFGRNGYMYNTFCPFDDNKISRRHFVIINQKNNVWLYDLSSLGTFVDAIKVKRRAFLLGRHEIKFGNRKIFIKSDIDLLL